MCLMWLTWKERNAQTFENIERLVNLLISLFMLALPFDLFVFILSAISLLS